MDRPPAAAAAETVPGWTTRPLGPREPALALLCYGAHDPEADARTVADATPEIRERAALPDHVRAALPRDCLSGAVGAYISARVRQAGAVEWEQIRGDWRPITPGALCLLPPGTTLRITERSRRGTTVYTAELHGREDRRCRPVLT